MQTSFALLLCLAPTTSGLYTYAYSAYSAQPTVFTWARSLPSSTPRWLSDGSTLSTSLSTAHLEALSLSISEDGRKLVVSGKKKIDGCQCSSSVDTEIPLPFTPRVEDVNASVEDDILTVTLAKHAKTSHAVPLQITTTSPVPEPPALSQEQGKPTLKDQETRLASKFRAVATFSSALASKDNADGKPDSVSDVNQTREAEGTAAEP